MEWKAGVRGVRLEAALIGVVARVSVRRQSKFAIFEVSAAPSRLIQLVVGWLNPKLWLGFLIFRARIYS